MKPSLVQHNLVELTPFQLIHQTLQVVLLYRKSRLPPSIWYCSRNLELCFLANDFTTYMRMAVAHLGIIQWQMAYAGLKTSETCSVRTIVLTMDSLWALHDCTWILMKFSGALPPLFAPLFYGRCWGIRNWWQEIIEQGGFELYAEYEISHRGLW